MEMKKIIVLMLLALISVTLLASCSDTPSDTTADTVADSTDTAPLNSGRLIADANGTKYYMVVPKDAKTLYNACADIKAEVYSLVSKNLFVKYDSSQTAGQYEILVGKTDRPESIAACAELEPKDYHIKWVGDKLVIAAGTDYAAQQGVKWLLDTYIRRGTSAGVYIPEDLDHRGSVNINLTFDKLSAGWNPLVYPAENGIEILYQIYMPENYDPNKEYACMLYMHSAGARFNDNTHIYTSGAKFLRNFESSKYKNDAIIIAPACPETDKWIPANTWKEITYDYVNTQPTRYMVAATELFNAAREHLSIDDGRLYIYGQSMGAFAAWDLIARNPDTFAAAIPVAGAGDPSIVSNMSGTAIWLFHGTDDATVPFASSQRMYDALQAVGRTDVKFTVFEGAGHGIWEKTADYEGILDWLFSQHR